MLSFPFQPIPTPLIFERSREGRPGTAVPKPIVAKRAADVLPKGALAASPPDLPEVPEFEVVRHYIELSLKNHHVDRALYPLGSCTMKYNPKVNEDMARLPGFAGIHPMAPDAQVQGALALMYELSEWLKEICGMDAITLQPAAGAQGEMTGIFLIAAYHKSRGDTARNVVIIPDSAHGTNPATSALAGFTVRGIKSGPDGLTDLAALKAALGPDVAALMLTNPSTIGRFETQVVEIAKLVHDAGALLYMDGANMNALIGITKPGDFGVDAMHLNLHKTFSTPHGGGGPGSGP
ncbi:MAG: aminomethyl-transferring glycine dehydrogenase subunit GcvPB, partial [Gemmatimonadales bacterium]